ncbi:Ribosomal_S17 domain-containing protein [Cephalotus follicularis]|uniref:Small ribosomal subunit protein uS17c n=1 Tax=Cephalotus follicularis TaxID=3775 RepID=A0A1Q3B9J6_CEPFO|nr:Ribosomal_S17 domain-containing protein [Cephalotus follicularis]
MLLPSSSSLSLHSLTLSTPFLHGSTTTRFQLRNPTKLTIPSLSRPQIFLPPIRAMKTMQGRVVCAASDKTVAVEVTRLAPHPKYKRRVRKKKKYQAHDADNQFKVGDFVQLLKSRPISKTKAFVAVPVPVRKKKKDKAGDVEVVGGELGLALESQQDLA